MCYVERGDLKNDKNDILDCADFLKFYIKTSLLMTLVTVTDACVYFSQLFVQV